MHVGMVENAKKKEVPGARLGTGKKIHAQVVQMFFD
jgi:hypothetical protein